MLGVFGTTYEQLRFGTKVTEKYQTKVFSASMKILLSVVSIITAATSAEEEVEEGFFSSIHRPCVCK